MAEFKIAQIYFRPDQLAAIDPDFVPYDNSKSTNTDYREYYVFRKEFDCGSTWGGDYRGYLSWKFGAKTGLSGSKFIEFCKANTGYDVYFVNPYPMQIALGNVWFGGEKFHPGIIELTQHIFDKIGYEINLIDVPNNLRINANCNFWVGNEKFWIEYMAFCKPVVAFIESGLDADRKKLLFSTADRSSGASFFAYIVERLFTTFLANRPDIKFLAYRFSQDQMPPRFSPREAELYLEMLKLEDAHPQTPNPLEISAPLRIAFEMYRELTWNMKPFRMLMLKAGLAVWNALPFRDAIKSNRSLFGFFDRWYRALRQS